MPHFFFPLAVPLPILAIGAVVYLVLCLGRWKVLLGFVVLNVMLFMWFVQMVYASHDPSAADGIFVALIIAVPAAIIAAIRTIVLLVRSP